MNELWDWDQAGYASRLALLGSLQSDRIDLRGVRAWDQYVMQVIAVPTTNTQTCLYLEWLRQFPGYATECVAKVDGKRITRADVNRFKDERRGRREASMKPAKVDAPTLDPVHDDEVPVVASEVKSATAKAQKLKILQKYVINNAATNQGTATLAEKGLEVAMAEAQRLDSVQRKLTTAEATNQEAATLAEKGLEVAMAEAQRLDSVQRKLTTIEATNQGTATITEEGLGAAMAEAQRLESVQRKLTTIEATNQEAATLAEKGLEVAMAEAQRLESVQRKLTTIEATNQEAATLAEKGLEVAMAEAGRLEVVQRKLKTVELANQAAAALAEIGLEAATGESLRVNAMQLEVDTMEAANIIAVNATNEAKYILVAATRERQQPPIWIGINDAALSTRSPVAACSYTAEGALGSETVWQLEGDRHCRAAVILPVAGAPDWRTLSPGRKSTVEFFVSEPMSDWTTVAVQDKAYDARSTVSCVGRGLFRFSNANTRFNQEVPRPLAVAGKFTLVTLKGTFEDMHVTAEVSSDQIPFSYSFINVDTGKTYAFGNEKIYEQIITLKVCLELEEGDAVNIAKMRFKDFYASDIEDHNRVFDALQTALSMLEPDTQGRETAQVFFTHLLNGGFSD